MSTWIFVTPTGGIDNYVYTAYFVDLKGTLHDFGYLYYGSRLPWILVGNAAYTIASPQTADTLLRLLLMYSATFSLYWIVRCIWRNTPASLLTAGLLGTHTYFLHESGWNYPDGAAISFTLVAIACLYAAFYSRYWQIAVALAGALMTAVICTQVFLIILMPPIILTFVLVQRYFSRPSLLGVLLCSSTGAALSFCFFGAVSLYLGGPFMAIRPQIEAAREVDLHAYIRPFAVWFPHAGWLAFPALSLLAVIGCAAWLGYRRMVDRSGASPEQRDLVLLLIHGLQLAMLLLILAIVESRGGAVLSQVFYGSYLIPFTFIVLGGLLSTAFNRDQHSPVVQFSVVLSLLVITLVPLKSSALRALPECGEGCLDTAATWSAIVAVSGLILMASISKRLAFAVLGVVLLSVLNGSIAERIRLFPPDTSVARQRANLIYTADRFIRDEDPDGRALFWYNIANDFGPVFRGVAAMHLWGYRLVGEAFPDLVGPSGTDTPVRSGSLLAVLSLDDDALTKARSSLYKQGLDVDVVKSSWLHEGNQQIHIDLVQVKPADLEPVSGFARLQPMSQQQLRVISRGKDQWHLDLGPDRQTVTLAQDWPASLSDRGGVIKISAQVIEGEATFSLLTGNGIPVATSVLKSSRRAQAIYLPFDELPQGSVVSITSIQGKRTRINMANASIMALKPGPVVECPCTLWPEDARPVEASHPDASAYELGVKFTSQVDGTIMGIRFYKGNQNRGPHTGSLWTSKGELLGTVSFNNETSDGWQEAFFDTPVPIRARTSYVASYYAPNGNYAANFGYFASDGRVSGPLRAPSSLVSGGNGVYLHGRSGYPNGTFQGANYWVDVIFEPVR